MTFSDHVIDYHFNQSSDWKLPADIHLIYPFDKEETRKCFSEFYKKYFDDDNKRHFLFGINPGRFGAGVTGVPFTDPKILKEECGIDNSYSKRQELSAIFVYEFIDALGGVEAFYSNFYITSVCHLGFIKANKNYNYYDSKELIAAVEPHIVKNISTQIKFGAHTDVAFSMGKGKNYKYLVDLNKKHQFFHKIIPLPHPRWVMQYKLRSKDVHIDTYVTELTNALEF